MKIISIFLGITTFLLINLAPVAFSQPSIDARCTTSGQNACVDWEKGYAISIGLGAPASWAKNSAQKNISAQRAAKLDAARNLLEMIKGINLSSSSTIKNAMVENDTVQSSIEGKLHSIRSEGPPKYFSDGSVQIKLVANLREVIPQELYYEGGTGAPRQLELPGSPYTGGNLNTQQVYTGLLIDARGTGVMPAMSPKIYDPDGREVYGSAYVSREWAISQGVVGYLKKMDDAMKNDRIKGQPAIVKAIEAKGANMADLVISKNDADALRTIAQKQTFLNEGRVLIVLD